MSKTFDNEFIKSLHPCTVGWKNLIKHYPNWSGTPLEFLELENIPIKDKQWLFLREEFLTDKELHLYACFCAESVLHIFEKKYPNYKRPRQAIEAKKKWLNNKISGRELSTARRAARVAADAAYAAAYVAAYAADGDTERKKQLEELKRIFREKYGNV